MLAFRLRIIDRSYIASKLCNESAHVGIRIIGSAQHVYKRFVIKAETGEVIYHRRLGHLTNHGIEEFTDTVHDRVFLALVLHANNHFMTFFPLGQKLRD